MGIYKGIGQAKKNRVNGLCISHTILCSTIGSVEAGVIVSPFLVCVCMHGCGCEAEEGVRRAALSSPPPNGSCLSFSLRKGLLFSVSYTKLAGPRASRNFCLCFISCYRSPVVTDAYYCMGSGDLNLGPLACIATVLLTL